MVIEDLDSPIIAEDDARHLKAIDYIFSLPWLPNSKEGNCLGRPSKAEIKRWLKAGVISLNRCRVKAGSIVNFPITELIFFPDNKHKKCTIWRDR